VPIFAQRETFPDGKRPRLVEITDGARVCGEIEVIEISGAVAGEVALCNPMNGGTLVIGDSLINCEPYGFAFLPRRYCLDEKEIRRSLRRLLRFRAEQILFAHGTPILSGANRRLEQLFGSSSRV